MIDFSETNWNGFSSPLDKHSKFGHFMNFVKQLRVFVTIAIAVSAASSPVALAQDLKIGVVNVPALMQAAPQAKVAMDALQEEFAPRQREVLAKQKEFDTLSEKVQRDVAVMGETERRNSEKDLRDLQREVARLQNEFQEDLNLRRNEELGNLQRSLLKEVQEFAQSEGYDLVVGDGVLFASNAVNITESVLKAMQANFQAAGN
jgi:outer membrane protein